MVSQEELKTRFIYDTNTGNLIWASHKRRPDLVGTIAGTSHEGRKQIYLNCKKYWAYRLIWLYHHGYMPEMIDHIDCDESNDRIENLRECTTSQNKQNQRKNKSNTSGIKGVSWNKNAKKWETHCSGNYLGIYETKEEAEAVVSEFRIKHHGEFARH